MVQLFLKGPFSASLILIDLEDETKLSEICERVAVEHSIPRDDFFLFSSANCLSFDYESVDDKCAGDYFEDGSCLQMKVRVCGGIDFQHREGGKTGGGGQLSESQAALERKERLRKLALETIDITKDPYFLRNHLGTFECKLCLTLHPNEVSLCSYV